MNGEMAGKTCLITGATSGIGKAAALQLAAMGAHVIVVGRNADKGSATVAEIKRRGGPAPVEFLCADLSSQQAIRELARTVSATYDHLDVLINNAGAVYPTRKASVDGIELTFALDYLGYFLLTELLLPLLKVSAPSRIVNVSSSAQRLGRIDFDDLQGAQRYSGMRAYSQAKLAIVLYTYELARRLQGTGVTANCLHPGYVATNLAQNNSGAIQRVTKLSYMFALSPAKGAETVVYLATSPLVANITGAYFVKKEPRKSSKRSYDEATAKRLGTISAQMTGLAT